MMYYSSTTGGVRKIMRVRLKLDNHRIAQVPHHLQATRVAEKEPQVGH